jgi:hypothetical protein
MAGRKPKPKPLFYFEALNPWDTIVIGFYGLATIIVLLYIIWGANKHKNEVVFFYAVVPQLFNYWLNYKSLKNLKVYFIWIGFAVMHVCLYCFLKNDPFYKGVRGALINTILLLVLYQLIRITSLKIQNQELAMPTKDWKDLFTNRSVTFLDFILFVIYSGCFYLLTIFAVSHSF